MTREWKPGDVADIPGIGRGVLTAQMMWATKTTVAAPHVPADGFAGVRPLVVIDPDSDEDLTRLLDLYFAGRKQDMKRRAALQAALREFADPNRTARIEEPATWGVVEASCVHTNKRMKWMRHEDNNWWPFVKYNDGDERRPLPDEWDSLVDPVLIRTGVSDD